MRRSRLFSGLQMCIRDRCISDRAAGRGGNRTFFTRHGRVRDGADIFVCGSAARIDAAHGRRFRKKCRSGRMDNAAVLALRADGRVHDARRRMVPVSYTHLDVYKRQL